MTETVLTQYQKIGNHTGTFERPKTKLTQSVKVINQIRNLTLSIITLFPFMLSTKCTHMHLDVLLYIYIYNI